MGFRPDNISNRFQRLNQIKKIERNVIKTLQRSTNTVKFGPSKY